MSWNDGMTENAVTVDSGQLHYRRSKALADDKTGWWDYTIALSDIDCVQFRRLKTGDLVSIMGKANDAVLEKADPNGTTHGYEAALRHVEIDFPADASTIAEHVVRDVTGSAPRLVKRINNGACAI
ncbi:MAG TPA: hypothetical protein VJP85_03895 [Candidatus Baltobacteraceae bacterium]|nr:hypothetical protein [Candidatus Baltobacteraceae bacterium]